MIKLKQVTIVHGEATLVFEADGFPDAPNIAKTIEISYEEISRRLRLLRQLTSRQPTFEDAKDVVVTLVNRLRQGKESLVPRFDFSSLIGVDLEGEG